MNRLTLIGVMVALTLTPAPALAQRPGPPPRAQMEERIRARFGEQVKRELDLTDEQLAAVQEVEASFQAQRRQLVQREAELRRQLRRFVESGSEEQARALLDEMAAVRVDEARLYRAEMDGLLRTLPAEKVLRFYRLRDELMERVRRLRQPAMDRLRPPGASPWRVAALTPPLGSG